jgi:hypothetical protein
MKRMLVLLAMMPVLALAKSPFDGTWKLKLDSVKYSGKPQEVELVGGKYTCKSCVPTFTIPADGKPQPTPGRVSSDHMAVKVASPTTVEYTRTLQGKVVGKGSDTVSADGNLMTSSFVDYSGEKPVDGKYTMKRVGPGVPGGHAISGSWMAEQAVDQSDVGSTIVLESTDNGMKSTWNGQVMDAKFDGKEYPIQNDPYHTVVTLKKVSDREFVEQDINLGKVQTITTYTVSADGKSLTMVMDDPLRGTKTSMVAEKQR